MVSFYVPQRKSFDRSAFELSCDSLDIKGQGVGRARGCVWFCEGLLPGEQARVQPVWQKGTTGQCSIIRLDKRSDRRLEDPCPLHGKCGGCPLAHIDPEDALKAKADGIVRIFKKAGIVLPEPSFIERSPQQGYRRSCRLAARFDRGQFRLGFRAGRSKDLCDVESCLTLCPELDSLLPDLKKLLGSLKCRGKIGHCELVRGDCATGMSLRVTTALGNEDEKAVSDFASQRGIVAWAAENVSSRTSESGKVETRSRLLCGDQDALSITSGGVRILCRGDSFVQVNRAINDAMVSRVLAAVDPKPGMSVLDLFCGIGNFTLPLAKAGASATGADVVESMTDLAARSAELAGIKTASFVTRDLDEAFEKDDFARGDHDAVVMDPGRDGATRACAYCVKRGIPLVVLISCNPLAAARDVPQLASAGWNVEQWGIFDMFPRTAHCEMMLVLRKGKRRR
jgi:23S rRNA (uracil1939-C5)-methyltransferase